MDQLVLGALQPGARAATGGCAWVRCMHRVCQLPARLRSMSRLGSGKPRSLARGRERMAVHIQTKLNPDIVSLLVPLRR